MAGTVTTLTTAVATTIATTTTTATTTATTTRGSSRFSGGWKIALIVVLGVFGLAFLAGTFTLLKIWIERRAKYKHPDKPTMEPIPPPRNITASEWVMMARMTGRCIPTDHTKKKKKANDQEYVSQDGESLDEEQQVRLLQDQQQQMQERLHQQQEQLQVQQERLEVLQQQQLKPQPPQNLQEHQAQTQHPPQPQPQQQQAQMQEQQQHVQESAKEPKEPKKWGMMLWRKKGDVKYSKKPLA